MADDGALTASLALLEAAGAAASTRLQAEHSAAGLAAATAWLMAQAQQMRVRAPLTAAFYQCGVLTAAPALPG